MNYFDDYIYTIFILKLIFMILSITNIYLKVKYPGEETDLDKNVVFWKETISFIFVFLMACLLIYLFFPSTSKTVEIGGATRELLYLFGIVVLFTAKWGEFFKESPGLIRLQNIIGINE